MKNVLEKRRRCCNCNEMTTKWQRVNGSPWHCYDGCYSTTGADRRTTTGEPLWDSLARMDATS